MKYPRIALLAVSAAMFSRSIAAPWSFSREFDTFALSSKASELTYSAIVAFGDSFSDNGNAWAISNMTWPANPNYYNGRFSNGPVWIEYVASNLSVPLMDYAVGGATTSNKLVQGYTGPNSTIPVPSVDEQVKSFLHSPPANVSLATPLFTFLAGANDPLFDANVTASESLHALTDSKGALSAAYPSATFLFLMYPDLARLPFGFYADDDTKRLLTAYSFNLSTLFEDAYGDEKSVSVTYVDLGPLFADFDYYASPERYGFAPLGDYGSCLTGAYGETPNVTLCADAGEMVFWDEYHPTTHTHSLVASLVLHSLTQ